ncbi:hypothetical protein JCM11641_006256 [Rhodosporidiobolus odoratus]
MAAVAQTVAEAAPPAEKISLPYPMELISCSSSPLADRFVVELELDHATLARLKREKDAKCFTSTLPGQRRASGHWSLQAHINDESIKLRLWRRTPGSPSCILAVSSVSLRIFSSTTGAWEELESVVTPGTDLGEDQAEYDICACAIPLSKIKEEDGQSLWSKRYRVEASLLYAVQIISADDMQPGLPAYGAEVAGAYPLSRSPHDLRLLFSGTSIGGRELWTSSDLLMSLSPYFKALLSSGFSEAVTYLNGAGSQEPDGKVGDTLDADMPLAPSEIEEAHEADSDDEIDEVAQSCNPNSFRPSAPNSEPYRQVKIKHTACSTYHAVLTYAMSGQLSFAPLRSCRASAADSSAYLASLRAHFEENPRHAPPVSPKSLYQLAHLLENDQLCILSLREFRRQLTPPIAVIELFSTTAAKYDDLRLLALNYVVKSWAQVKDSDELKKVKERIKNGEMPHAAPVLMELVDKLEERRAGMLS